MPNLSQFCTCKDTKCPLHPTNHDKGCSLCIAKNLKSQEIPSCFFNVADPQMKRQGYSFEDFANLFKQYLLYTKRDYKNHAKYCVVFILLQNCLLFEKCLCYFQKKYTFLVIARKGVFSQLHYSSRVERLQYIRVSKSILYLEDFNKR